jgi:uncharacterized damage-inducible protein DinB
MIEAMKDIFLTELNKLEQEIKSIPDDALWKTSGGIKNSCGNLCLHLCGNLQHYVGAILGKSGYMRNRDAEFSSKNISKEKLLTEIMKAKEAISKTVPLLNKEDLQKIYPQDFLGKDVTTEYFLIHLLSHFDYHLGQINYLRRIL